MDWKPVGRALRANPLTARLLTEYRLKQLTTSPAFADLRECIRLSAPNSTAVDVGASVGNYALAMARAVGDAGRVLAIEANPTVFKELQHSTSGAKNVTALNVAASSHSGTADLFIPLDEHGHRQEPIATLERRTHLRGNTVSVNAVTLDELLVDADAVSIVKIDVEGHEGEVLAGAVETIRRHRPAFVMEIETQHLVDRTVGDVVGVLTGQGYSCFGLHGDERIPWEQFDVDRWQADWLCADPAARQAVDYVNNFLFTP